MLKQSLGKRRMRVLTVFLAVALLLSCIPVFSAGASSSSRIIIMNQTFEGVTDLAAEGWSVGTANQYGIATDVAHGGSQSLVRNPGNAWGRWGDYKFTTEADTDYEFSFWVNTSQGFLLQLVKMANGSDAGVLKEFRDDTLNTNGEWKQYTLSFNSGSTVQYKINICTGVTTTEPTYYDDFVLEAANSDLTALGTQLRAGNYALRFGFSAEIAGVTADNYSRVMNDATIQIDGTTYTVTDFGVMLSAKIEPTNADLSVDATAHSSAKVSAEKLYNVEDGVVTFVATLYNIPADKYDRAVSARAYVEYEDAFGAKQYIYSDTISKSVNDILNVMEG